jgi:hypothetical protein
VQSPSPSPLRLASYGPWIGCGDFARKGEEEVHRVRWCILLDNLEIITLCWFLIASSRAAPCRVGHGRRVAVSQRSK